jgi:hypothetical protein
MPPSLFERTKEIDVPGLLCPRSQKFNIDCRYRPNYLLITTARLAVHPDSIEGDLSLLQFRLWGCVSPSASHDAYCGSFQLDFTEFRSLPRVNSSVCCEDPFLHVLVS